MKAESYHQSSATMLKRCPRESAVQCAVCIDRGWRALFVHVSLNDKINKF